MLLQKPRAPRCEVHTKDTNGGHIQHGPCSLAGRALLVRSILYDNKSITDQFDVRPRTVRRWLKRVAEGESLEDRPHTGRPRTVRTPEALKLTYSRLLRTKEDIVAAYEEAWEAFPMSLWEKFCGRLPKVLKQIKKDKGSNRNTV